MFIVTKCVIACDPKEAILHNQLGEDRVGLNILYFLSNVSIMMIIRKWPLFQTILDGFTLRELIISYDETHVPTIVDEGKIGVKKKQYTF